MPYTLPLNPNDEDFITCYVAAAPVHAIVILGIAEHVLVAVSDHARPRLARADVDAAFFVADRAVAEQLAARTRAGLGGMAARVSGCWHLGGRKAAPGILRAEAAIAGVDLIEARKVRARAARAVDRIEADFEERRRTGELRSVNPGFRATAAARGQAFTSWGDMVVDLKRREIESRARREGAALLAL